MIASTLTKELVVATYIAVRFLDVRLRYVLIGDLGMKLFIKNFDGRSTLAYDLLCDDYRCELCVYNQNKCGVFGDDLLEVKLVIHTNITVSERSKCTTYTCRKRRSYYEPVY